MMFRRPPPPEPSEHERRIREAENRRARLRVTICQRPVEEILRTGDSEEIAVLFDGWDNRALAMAFTWLRDGGTRMWTDMP